MNSIAMRLVMLLVLVAGGVILLLSLMTYHAGELAITRELETELKVVSNRLKASLKESVNEFDRATIQDTVKAEFPNSDLAAVMVWAQGRQRLLCGVLREDNHLVDIHGAPKGPHIISASYPIGIMKGVTSLKVGEIDIFLDRTYPEMRLRASLARSVGKMLAVVALLLTILSLIVSRYLVRPLDSLRQTMTSTEEASMHAENGDAWRSLGSKANVFVESRLFPELNTMRRRYGSMVSAIIGRNADIQEKEENLRITLNSIGDEKKLSLRSCFRSR